MKESKWAYRPLEPLDLAPGTYKILIFAGDHLEEAHSPGKSACAWEIRNDANEIIESPEPLVTVNDQSSQWRGYIAASTRGLERLPNRSTAILCSHNGGFLKSVDAVDGNKANGWQKKGGGEYADVDIWERYLLARDGANDAPRRITVVTAEAESELDREIIKRLREKVAAALDKATGRKPKKR